MKFERMAGEAMDTCLRVLAERKATKAGSTATVLGTVYLSYPILTFLEVAVYKYLHTNATEGLEKTDVSPRRSPMYNLPVSLYVSLSSVSTQ